MDQKNSDKLFREKLGGMTREPDPHVWDRIETSLNKRRSRRVVPIWWILGGTAAALILGLMLVAPWSEPQPSIPGVTDTDLPVERTSPDGGPSLNPAPEAGIADTETQEVGDQPSETDITSRGRDEDVTGPGKTSGSQPGRNADKAVGKSPWANALAESESSGSTGVAKDFLSPEAKELRDRLAAEGEVSVPTATEIAGEPSTRTVQEKDPAAASAVAEAEDKGQSIYDAIAEAEDEVQRKEDGSRWEVGPSLAPVYYSSFGDGSPISPNFVANSKSGTLNMSYGLSVAYAISDKLSVRSGIHKVDFGYNTDEVSFTSTLNAGPSSLIRTISYSENSKNLVVHSTAGGNTPQADLVASDVSAPSPQREGQMVQEFGYLEVPMELQYNLVDKRLGLNLIGGMSSLFLVDNSVSLSSAGSSTQIGEATNMNPVNFSGNFGLGLYYQLNPNMQVNMQPMFKYHLNTFTNTAGNFRPYSVGVYSGLSFRF